MESKAVLVDTSAWILALRKHPLPGIKKRIDELLRDNLLILNGVIKLELLSGVKSEEEFKRLKSRLDALPIIETTVPLWDYVSELAFQLRGKGVAIPTTDLIIAATALQNKTPLLHVDIHFDLVAKYTELKVESFVSSVKKIL